MALALAPQHDLKPIWTEEETQQIQALLRKKHIAFLEGESFSVVCGETSSQMQMVVTLQKNDLSLTYPVEIVYLKPEHPTHKSLDVALSILDYIDAYFTEFFSQERNVYLPLDWSSHAYEGFEFFMRGFIRNLKLEQQADALLQEFGHGTHTIYEISSDL